MGAPSPNRDHTPALRERAQARVAAARTHYERSWAGDIGRQIKDLDFVNWITMFGASLLWSAVPLIVLLSSLANDRVDDDISRHIGLDTNGARIVHSLFRARPAHAVEPILTGILLSLAGVVAAVSSLQQIYERIFGQEHRGWRNLPRWIAWTAVLLTLLTIEGAINGPARRATGRPVLAVIGLATNTLFFWWTMHFLLAGRVRWRRLVRPAATSALLWLALALFSTVYFSPILISDSRTYGTIGVVFTLLTWFFLIGGVVVLGAVCGAAWQARVDNR